MALIQRIAAQAAKTFRISKGSAAFQQQLSTLKELTRTLTADALNFDLDLVRDQRKFNPDIGEAPFAYIGIFEDKVFSMGVFVLRSTAALPIHDHPDMHGIVKVIHGSVSVKSYTKVLEPTPTNDSSHRRRLLRVKAHDVKRLTPSDGVCCLDPVNANFHEVSTEDTPGAFFDILAPPYDHGRCRNGPRICRYYCEIDAAEQGAEDARYLMEIQQPSWLWGSHAEYQGHRIESTWDDSTDSD